MGDFDGDFELLPVASALRSGAVPEYPTSDDFQHAAMAAVREAPGSWAEAASVWFREAVRQRRWQSAVTLDAPTLKLIAVRVADELFTRAKREREAA